MKSVIAAALLTVSLNAVPIHFEDLALPSDDRPNGVFEISIRPENAFFRAEFDFFVNLPFPDRGNLHEPSGRIGPDRASIVIPWEGVDGVDFKLYEVLASEFGKLQFSSQYDGLLAWNLKFDAFIDIPSGQPSHNPIPTPDTGSTVLLLGLGMLPMLWLKRKFA